MNDGNLIPFSDMHPERHRELSRLGGIASGKARREKAYKIKTMRYLSMLYASREEQRANPERTKRTPPVKRIAD